MHEAVFRGPPRMKACSSGLKMTAIAAILLKMERFKSLSLCSRLPAIRTVGGEET